MSLDGVIDNPQNWSAPYWDEEHAAYAQKLMADSDELLLGRKTYEGFSAAWPQRSGEPLHGEDQFDAEARRHADADRADLERAAAPRRRPPGGRRAEAA